jgi:hypothetical protein
VPHNEPPRKSQRARRSAISDDYEVYISEEIQMKGDPTSFEEVMRMLIHPNGLMIWKMK